VLRSRAAQAVLLALLAAAPYLEVVRHDFVGIDDGIYIYGHPSLGAPLSWASAERATSFEGNWIPLTWLSMRLGRAVHGVWAPGFLVGNVLLHAASAAVLFLALARMTGAAGPAAFVAAVFGVHPLHVESVAWVAERKDVLSGLFFMLALLAHARAAERPSRGRRALVAAWMVLGLLAKPMLVTLPCVLLLLDYWPLGRLRAPGGAAWPAPRRLADAVAEKAPLFALSVAFSWVAWRAQRSSGAAGFGETLGFPARLANALVAIAAYTRDAFWPEGLAIFYPYPEAILPAEVALAGAAIALATALALACVRSRPYALVGWLWYVGTLVPVLGLVQVGMQARADRYTYLPLVGLAIAVAWGLRDLAGPRRRALAAVAAAAVLLLAVAAAAQVRHWRDTRTLFARALAVTRGNYMVHYFLAENELVDRRLDEAERHSREALRLRPTWLEPRLALADVALMRGRQDEALAVYEDALREHPGNPVALAHLGVAQVRLGAYPEARRPLEQAVAAYPNAPALHLALALVEAAAGDPEAALDHERLAFELDPGDVSAANNLGWRLATISRPELRDPALALRLATRVVEEKGGSDPGALDTLAAAQAAGGDFAAALRTADEALRIARERVDAGLAEEIAARRALYAAGRAYVDGDAGPAR
jgi:tetratricopeptide (TPR) repeat protein